MLRLIDADELMWHKSSLVEPRDKTVSMGKPISQDEVCAYRLGWNDAIDAIIENAPTVDAVEVVYCKDCKSAERKYKWYCVKRQNIVNDDDFCSWGERKDAKIN